MRATLAEAACTLDQAGFADAYRERRLNVTPNVATVTSDLAFGGAAEPLVTDTRIGPHLQARASSPRYGR
jgi:hypothetical protein